MTRRAIEQIFPLSPAQHGLIAQELAAPGSGRYVVQLVATLIGPLDVDAFRTAWISVQRRHDALRSSFVWEKVAEPLRVVHRDAPLPFAYEPAAGADWLDAFLPSQREAALRLKQAPLFSVAVARTGGDTHHLVWCYHHLLLDGWSAAIILRGVFDEYDSIVSGRTPSATRLAPYDGYVRWLQRRDLASHRDFWQRELDGFRPGPRRSDAGAPRPATARLMLSEELNRRLKAFLRSTRITSASFVHALWALLIARRTGADEVAFGSVVSGRPDTLPDAENLVGLLINVLPFRTRVPVDETADAWLRSVQRHLVDVRRFGAVSLVQVSSWAGCAGASLFDSVLTIENYPDAPWHRQSVTSDVPLKIADVHFVESTHYALAFEAVPADRLVFQLLYDEARTHPDAVTRLLEDARLTIGGLIDMPHQRLATVLARGDATAVIAAARSVDRACSETLVGRWSAAATAHAPRIAVVCDVSRVTYRELDVRAKRIADAVAAAGVGPDDPVALLLDRSVDMIAAILGTLMAGGCFTPIEPATPPERLSRLLADCGAKTLVTTAPLLPCLGIFEGKTVVIDGELDACPKMASVVIHPDQAAYVIYTSGSTGDPKGVVVTHRNVVRLFDETATSFHFGPDDVWTLFHSYGFDFSIWELFGALLHGGRLVVVPQTVSRSPDEFLALLRQHDVTVLNQTPSAFRMLAAELADQDTPPSLRLIIFGGEALPFPSLATWCARRGCRPALINMYGITETTVHVTYRPVDPLDPEWIDGGRIGASIHDLRIELVNPDGERVADGTAGEMWIGGPGLARGYLHDPALTSARFVPDPWSATPGARLYRSGDLARRLPNGDLEFLGRLDRQIKSRGFRIEPGEIEAALRSHPAIDDAIVVQRRTAGDSTLVANIIPAARTAMPVRRLVGSARRTPGLRLLELPNGVAVFHLNPSETAWMFDEVFESACYLGHGIEVRSGDCVFDVGANIGIFALYAHLHAADLTVYAFEPIREVYDVLAQNVEAHGVVGRTFNLALGAAAGEELITYFPHVTVMSTRDADAPEDRAMLRSWIRQAHASAVNAVDFDEMLDDRLSARRVPCRVERLSAVLASLPVEVIDLLKVDVEGSEEDVFDGIDDPDWSRIRQVVVEVHGEARLQRLVTSLGQRGFTTAVAQQTSLRNTTLFILYGVSKARASTARRPVSSETPAQWRSPARLVDDVRRHLGLRLPEYMQPHRISLVDRFPLTVNGKIDESAIGEPLPHLRSGHTAPRTEIERQLAGIWEALLSRPAADRDANFFELGGDSILAVQMVSRARQLGIHITARQVFEQPSIAGLARAATAVVTVREDRRPARGPVALTPIQRWFFERPAPNRHHWNQAVMFDLVDPVPVDVLESALCHVADHHDAFRLRFNERDGEWRQEYAATPGAIPLVAYPAEREADAIAEAHRGLHLADGPLLRAALLEPSATRCARLLLVAHHLVIDASSWRIVVEDLMTAAGQLSAGETVRLPASGATYQQWSEWLAGRADDAAARWGAAPYFASLAVPQPPVPRDLPGGAEPPESSVEHVVVALSPEETTALGARVAHPSRSRPGDVVLAAAALALARWSGSRSVRIDVESHGRQDGGPIDVSRTVGWFTNLYPVVLDVGDAPELAGLLQAAKAALAGAPEEGLSYGLLRYVGDADSRARWSSLPRAEISFNHLGDLDRGVPSGAGLRVLDVTAGTLHDPDATCTHLLGIESAITGGGLRLTWSFSGRVHRRQTIQRLASDTLIVLRRMIAQAAHAGATLLSPADFPAVDLTPAELETVVAAYPRVEDILRLTPAQQGILFHALYEPDSTVYFTQFYWTFHGDLDIGAFEQSWRVVLDRHAVLRSAFAYRGLREPHQIVCAGVDIPLVCYDWREQADATADAAWQRFLQSERERRFDPARPPLMRLALVRTADREHRFVWNHHHILFDGWSTGLILCDLFEAYDALSRGAPLPDRLREPAIAYREYAAWLRRQDPSAGETYWRAALRDVAPMPSLSPAAGQDHSRSQDGALVHRTLPAAADGRLRACARATGLTVNTLVMGAWALVLRERCGVDDVVFGSTVAGRPADLEGADRIVGLFINTLPVCARAASVAPMVEWLRALQRTQAAARDFEHVSLPQIQRWAGLPAGRPLFETAIVFENLPEFSIARPSIPGLEVDGVGSFVQNHFPLTIRGVPSVPLVLEALFDPGCLSRAAVEDLVGQLEKCLDDISGSPSATVGDLIARRAQDRLAVLRDR